MGPVPRGQSGNRAIGPRSPDRDGYLTFPDWLSRIGGAYIGGVKEWQTLLFLCTGNYYRSRYAEAWFNHHAQKERLHWRAESRGFRPHLEDSPLSHHAADRLEMHSIPRHLTRNHPLRVVADDLAEASLVVALYETEHRPMVARRFPMWTDRIRYWNVPDIDEVPPYAALPMIEREVDALVQHLSRGHALGARQGVTVEF